MITTEPRPFTASTSKLAYAQAFSNRGARRHSEQRSLLGRLVGRRSRTRSA